MTEKEKQQQTNINEPLTEDMEIMGPFNSVEELMKNTWDAED